MSQKAQPDIRTTRASKGLSAMISVRFTPDEVAIIRTTAQARGIAYSAVVREAVRALQGKDSE